MAASNLTLRSGSISSSSTASSKTSNDAIKKKFACSHPGCGKSFSRSEHLHRHALNHKDGNHTCLRCSAHFRRRDLLDRHVARHKEKDDEAGGEGLGVLATRKRLWRDADGNIVNARRPSYAQDGNKRRMIGRSSVSESTSTPTARKNSQVSFPGDERRQSTSLPSPMSRVGSTHSTIVVDTRQSSSYNSQSQNQREEDDEEEELDQNPSWLPSPPQSNSFSPSLPSSAQSPSSLDAESELDTLYDHHTSWPPLSGNSTASSSSHHLLSTNSPIIQSDYPSTPTWGGSSAQTSQSSFQTFMGSVGDFDDGIHHQQQSLQLKDSEYGSGIRDSNSGNSSLGPLTVGMGLGGIYGGWQNPWDGSAPGGQMMLSRVREEKFETASHHQQHSPYLNSSSGVGVDGRSMSLGSMGMGMSMGYSGGLQHESGMRRGFLGTC